RFTAEHTWGLRGLPLSHCRDERIPVLPAGGLVRQEELRSQPFLGTVPSPLDPGDSEARAAPALAAPALATAHGTNQDVQMVQPHTWQARPPTSPLRAPDCACVGYQLPVSLTGLFSCLLSAPVLRAEAPPRLPTGLSLAEPPAGEWKQSRPLGWGAPGPALSLAWGCAAAPSPPSLYLIRGSLGTLAAVPLQRAEVMYYLRPDLSAQQSLDYDSGKECAT
ncbi:hypothetical protein J0S82_014404, partial [Galemys pyrenaicus]